MRSNINGRLRKFNLRHSEGLIPVQEAIVNSIQAKAKNIDVEIIRENFVQKELGFKGNISKIISFKIIDDGIGLNEENFNSFDELDSEYKLEIGGKGIGRISYLKVFREAKIKSIYSENGEIYCRSFLFKNTEKGIEDLKLEREENKIDNKTIVELIDFKENYRKDSPKKTEDIARQLLLYLLAYFINENNEFDIKIIDKGNEKIISLREIFNKEYKLRVKEKTIEAKEETFNLKYMLLDGNEENEICYVAHNRKVFSEKIKKYDGLLKGPFDNHYLIIYISGKYFDNNINDERTDFTFIKSSKLEERLFLTLEDIVLEVLNFIKKEYKTEYEKLLEQNEEILSHFIKDNPQYRALYNSNTEILTKINSDMSIEKIDSIFYNLKKDIQKKIKIEIETYSNERKEDKEKILKMVSDVEKTNLVEYVINRKLILDFLEKSLETDEEGKYRTEDIIHDIFFPTKTSSDEIEYEEHNLWLIDDRLSFHNYAFSDETILKKEEKAGYKRPDILIYNKPILIKDIIHKNEEESFYIIEFKRPQRNDYTDDENPIDQVLNYAKDIREQRLKIKGRPVKPNNDALIYAFVICDITSKLKMKAGRYKMNGAPDEGSFYGYFPEERVFLEMYSFDKILDNAKKRNRIFFEKLGLDY